MTDGSGARANAATASLDGAAYTFGGIGAASPFYLTDNDEYVTDVWTAKADIPSPSLFDHEGMTVGSYCYAVYGEGSSGSKIRDADQYDPAGNSWASKTDAPANARAVLGAAGIGSKGYTWGGFATTNLRDCEEYDPSGDSWASRTDLPTPARSGCGGFDIGGKGYAIGGSAAGLSRDVDEYDPSADGWTNKGDMLTPARQWFGEESFDASVAGYITAGQGSTGSRIRDHDEYTPDTWTERDDVPTPARQFNSSGFVA